MCIQLQQDSLVWQQEANNNVSEIQVTLLPLTEQVVHIAALIAYTSVFLST